MKSLFRRPRCRDEKGQSLVEFALVLPVLLLLVLGIIEFGWLFNAHIILTGSAREGAREAVVVKIFGDASDPVISDEVDEDGEYVDSRYYIKEAVLKHTSTTFNDVQVSATREGSAAIVEVEGTLSTLIGFFLADEVTLKARATMRVE